MPDISGCSRRSLPGAVCLTLLTSLLVQVAADPNIASAQTESRTVPKPIYFASFAPYYDGDYKSALKAFRDAARSGVRSTEGRWIDSICYHAMIGECYYHMGELTQAMDQYNAACKLYLAHRDWMMRVQFPETINPSASSVQSTITWGVSTRRPMLGRLPDVMTTFQGRMDNDQVIKRGGVVAPPMYYPIVPQEIVRCTVLALRRRAELLGPVCAHDPLTIQMVEALSRRPTKANHWSQAWVSAQLGAAYAGAGKAPQAITEFKAAERIGGRYDHPLTATILLELGKLAFQAKNYDLAANYFLEATFAAVPFNQGDVMEEGFRWGLLTHQVSGQKGMYAPVTPQARAANWMRTRGFRTVQASLAIMASENYTSVSQPGPAAGALEDARRAIGTREMRAGAIGGRFQYQLARVNYQKGDIKAGDAALALTMAFQKHASKWLYQIAVADQLFVSGAVTERVGMLLYDSVLREPLPADWSVHPMESLSVVVIPHVTPMEHWFAAAIKRKEPERALEIADRVRRHRFFSTLTMGGRLLALRWVLEAPKEALSEQARLQRQDLLIKYPKYEELSRASAGLDKKIAAMPIVPDDTEQLRQLQSLMSQMSKVSGAKEVLLREIALGRNPSEFAFPPLHSTEKIRENMANGQMCLTFFTTTRFVYAFLFTNDQYAHWQVEAPATIGKRIVSMLQSLGHYKRDGQLTEKELADTQWQEDGAELLKLLSKGAPGDFWSKYDELVIVPDGMLWYLPFEALPVTNTRGTSPLISQIKIRYLPTVGLLVPDDRGRRPLGDAAVVLGKLFPRDEVEVALEAYEEFHRVLPTSKVIPSPPPAPTGLAAKWWDGLLVLDDLDDPSRGPYDWSPARVDRGKAGGALASWFTLPWGGPDWVVLPGFHTAAEDAVRTPAQGEEVFLTLCGLMSSGVRTVVLSRWRMGGQTSYDLMREFLQELPHTSPAASWQRSVALTIDMPIDPMREPRLRLSPTTEEMTGRHPAFWSGYILSTSDAGKD